ncbi:sel1 repeat family protein [Duganella sp. FT3S]|uniref:Sel1 repeat family protein n=1 Tax=Rugamonas fusca TaxID=2758568 RepID=A0A7W2I6Q7_9BURK|nr:tetratricopeptide repeat protein [Rugamonas fusca]MBA5605615.1 sel1 repeat family protein [Rugamonas fusca]
MNHHTRKANGGRAAYLSLSTLALTLALSACQLSKPVPAAAQIESMSMRAAQQGDVVAESRLRDWAQRQVPVAQRELGLLYLARPDQRAEAQRLFMQAARAGDTEAAFQLAQMLRNGAPGIAAAPDQAIPWYRQAAQQKHARAALMLGMLFNNGEGVGADQAQGARWLSVSSDLGNAHAMFLLSNAYREGRGVERNEAHARQLLEEAAEHEYPPAIQELAMAVQTGDALSARDELRAAHLLKEAAEHRHNNWNRF